MIKQYMMKTLRQTSAVTVFIGNSYEPASLNCWRNKPASSTDFGNQSDSYEPASLNHWRNEPASFFDLDFHNSNQQQSNEPAYLDHCCNDHHIHNDQTHYVPVNTAAPSNHHWNEPASSGVDPRLSSVVVQMSSTSTCHPIVPANLNDTKKYPP
jgi:hypothetical protein